MDLTLIIILILLTSVFSSVTDLDFFNSTNILLLLILLAVLGIDNNRECDCNCGRDRFCNNNPLRFF